MEKELKILMIEDSHDDARLIERILKKDKIQFNSSVVDSEEEFTKALTTFNPDVILSDHALPSFNSKKALSICRSQGINVPFILVTGTVSEEFAVSCLKDGADDYILKANLARLPSAIHNALKQRQAEAERKHAECALVEQNEALIKVNKELDSFVYSVSHNLRAPLLSVLGLINLAEIEDSTNNISFLKYSVMMKESIKKLDETLKEILDYSRNARSSLKIDRVNLKELVYDSFERVKYLNGFEGIEKRITIHENVPVYSDEYRLGIIFNNLISNAIKYLDKNKEKSFIDLSIEIDSSKILILFKDNGIGIEKAYIEKVFQMFFRATEKSEGAGLGLYIVKETIDKLRGNISIESELAKGTTFIIELPNFKPVHISSRTLIS